MNCTVRRGLLLLHFMLAGGDEVNVKWFSFHNQAVQPHFYIEV